MRIVLLFLLISAFSFAIGNASAQGVLIKIPNDGAKTTSEIFELIEAQTDFTFIYSDESIKNATSIAYKKGEVELIELLDKALSPIHCDYKITNDGAIIIRKITNQRHVIKGKITDKKGLAIPGANIVEEGTTNGVTSDLDGNYSIQVSYPATTLIISYIGYGTQDIEVNNRSVIDITLLEEASELDEVLVTALRVERNREELGYSFQNVKGDELADNPTLSVAQSLYGKVAGVNITQAATGLGGSSRVVIRGNNSINGDNQPLYIVDGIYIGNSGIASITDNKSEKFSGGLDNGDGLSSINVNDIENVSVLKGGAASALYGERGANGVIIITTKKGKANSFSVDYNGTFTLEHVNAKYKDNQTSYGSGSNGQLPDPNDIGSIQASTVRAWGPKFADAERIRIFDGSYKPYKEVDNHLQDFFRNGVSYNHNLSIFGGADNTTYRFSYGNLKKQGVIPQNEFERNSYALSTSVEMGKLTMEGKLTYIVEELDNSPALADDPNNIGFSLAGLAPNIDESWLKHYQDSQGNYYNWNPNPNLLNPYFVIAENTNHSNKNRILGNFHANYMIKNWLKADFNVGLDRFSHDVTDFLNGGTELPGKQGGSLTNREVTFQEYNIQGILFANETFGRVDVSAAVGGNHRNSARVDGGYSATGMLQRGVNNLSNFSDKVLSPKVDQEILVKSVFSYLRANYNNFLFLDLTVRNDWNSTLATPNVPNAGPKNDYSFFYPSISGSFIFSEMLQVSPRVLTFGKLRASLARTGKAPDQPYATSRYYTIGPKPLLGNPLGFIPGGTIPNGELKPEISNTFEIGTDLSFLNNRIALDFTYYRTITKNQLTVLSISQASGYYSAWQNIGEVKNNGIEAVITAGILKNSQGLNWNTTLNIAKNNNEVIRLNGKINNQVISIGRWSGVQVIAQEGKSTSELYGQSFLRSPGGEVIVGENGLPKLNPTYKTFGKAAPDWVLGFTQELSYKGFALAATMDMKFGGYVYSMTNAYAAAAGLLDQTVKGRDEYNQWVEQKLNEGLTLGEITKLQPEAGYVVDGVVEVVDSEGNVSYEKNTIAVNPQSYWGSFFGDDAAATPEPFVYSASYVKLRQLALSYTLPRKVLQNIVPRINLLRISFIGRNLWTIHSKIPNIDPESTYTAGNGQGLEYGSLPYSKSYGFNIQMTF
ncbi:SusC/RagA family TonB-linked outer membrane protein [Fulvivirga sediminis]|uniref:SusC/RagA family TonB-linked outer membrane protein n=1 Tax=Fulvivirga sediminis TaxID=2803949 RepID=A0A937FB64_9BACT|nr:SusC/RagA family TonB-linked outer membrane protein [Fulvivirga sediminis]MBL3658402.1 SusC/RagA family TonB-linked outer membrane protein [Fulvivirga sediminis]